MNEIVNEIDLGKLPRPYVESHPEWIELYDFAWKLAAKNIRECDGKRYMDCAWDFSRNYQWVWDTCFVTLYARYGNGIFPGISSLDNFYKFQREDGYIAMTYDLNTGDNLYGERINPPLFAWVEWEYYMTTNDSSRFETIVPKIEKLMDWIDANRRCDPRQRRFPVPANPTYDNKEKNEPDEKTYPFYYFTDCGSSGMDDSPRTPRLPDAGKFFDWIDLSSQMALSFRMLAKINGVLNDEKKSAYWNKRADELSAAINDELWCEKTRFYHDRSVAPNFVNSKTIAGFWPILAKIASDDKLDSLINHLGDEKTFNRPVPIPTLSADDCNYCENGTYWIGGVWAPTNYMVTRGLMLADEKGGDTAHAIAIKYLDALCETYKNVEPHSLWEAYSAEKPLPGLSAYQREFVKPDFVGWTGIGPIAMLIENILGIEINAPERRIDWNIRLRENHGIENLKVGDAIVNLKCEFPESNDGEPKITIDSSEEIDVRVNFKQ